MDGVAQGDLKAIPESVDGTALADWRNVQETYQRLFHQQRDRILINTDRLFGGLMIFQWICGILAALYITPWTWLGVEKSVHPHVWMAIGLGGAITSVPVLLCWLNPGKTHTRIVVAMAQMLWSGLLIHLTGGRLETHFHVFGSLAFLAFYLDWKVLVVATAVVGFDHFVRGVYFPQSVFGTVVASSHRWLEHVGWVLFENCFLIAACNRGLREVREMALRSAQLHCLNEEVEDVVAQRTAALAEKEARFRAISASSPVGIYQEDQAGNYIYTNARWHEILGTDAGQNDAADWNSQIHPEDQVQVLSASREAAKHTKDLSLEYRILQPSGEIRWVQSRSRTLYSHDNVAIGRVGTLEDITDRRRDAEALERGAYYDSLTGLPNRVAIKAALERSIAQSKRRPGYIFGVLFLDLDRFKIVNDSLGHAIGDRLLVEAAQRLASSIRSSDMVARLGGDEFVILMDGITSVSDVTCLAAKIQESLAAKFSFDGHKCFVSASIGITLSTMNYDNSNDLLRDADVAMYRAKAAGGQTYFIFNKAMHQAALDRLRMESDLRTGLKRSQFSLALQPIIKLSTGRIVAFEALVRWDHPVRGLVSPSEFVPVAEETNLILPLGNKVLSMACEWLDQMNEICPEAEVAVTVNVSGLQLAASEFVDHVAKALSDSKFHPRQLNLEITETILMENAERTASILQNLRDLGVRIWVDDFGTGYSSLAYLDRFPIDVLKIDRSFISGQSSGNAGIVKAVIALAETLELQVVGEGIESADQREHLAALGCDLGQGFLISPPLSPAEAFQMLVAEKLEARNDEPGSAGAAVCA